MAAKTTIKTHRFLPHAYWREVLAILMMLLAIFFFRSERKELHAIMPQLRHADVLLVIAGTMVTLLYFALQGGIYRECFGAIGLHFSWTDSVVLFLKRNFVSIFLPAGGVSSLAYSPSQIRRSGFAQSQVHQASALFGFAGLMTLALASIPVAGITIWRGHVFGDAWIALGVLILLLWEMFRVARSIRKKGRVYTWIAGRFPKWIPAMDELFAANVSGKRFGNALIYSSGVEITGMIHIYIAMLALHLTASPAAAASAYIVSVLLMVVSPFLRGLGAVELSMVFVLQKFGYPPAASLAVTLLYRVFEFWMPLVAGLLVYAWKCRKLFLRLAPAALTFFLGIINIISAVTAPLRYRINQLHEYIPFSAIHASNTMVLFAGLALLVTAAFLFRGMKSAWTFALLLASFSLAGHLTKALDYEEAILAGVTIAVLLLTSSQYYVRTNSKWVMAGVKTALLSFVAVLLFGFISFYFIDRKHFGVDFTWNQSLSHTLKIFLLVEDSGLRPITRFGHEFVNIIRALGFFTWAFLFFTLIRPKLSRQSYSESFRDRAVFLITQYGNSAIDYFKIYKDKLYFFSSLCDGFIAYRIARGFAIVLEVPVCAEENKISVLAEFDAHCRAMGLRTAFYRVDENSMPVFDMLKKKKLIIGQEAILDIGSFDLDGREKKSLRNGLNSLQKKGYTVSVQAAPHSNALLAELKQVSDDWLHTFSKKELVFSQGMFDERELQYQDIITLQDEKDQIQAFLNIIPDYAEDECTYDLIRKTSAAPGAAMDALIIKLIETAREQKKQYINLGLVPMTGITQPANTAEQIMKLAASKIRTFQQYRGLREFKEKYATFWQNKYLVYETDFDLIQLPMAINNVMKP